MPTNKPWDKLSEDEQTPEAGYREAVRRIAVCKAEGEKKLDLDGLQLTAFPPELEQLIELEGLEAEGNQITELGPIAELKNLTELWLSDNPITELGPIAELKNLTTLWLQNNKITELGPIAELKNLISLYLQNNQITELGPIAELKNLTSLWLQNNQITELGPIAELKNLTSLWLQYNQITELGPIAKLKNLTSLYLQNNQITKLGPIAKLKNLTTLYLQNNQITELGPIAELKNLTTLWLQNNQITELGPIAKLKNLTTLGLQNNQITELGPIAELKNLTSLGLQNNQITELGPIAELKNLTSLYLKNNQITELGPIAELKNLTSLYLKNNQITELGPIAELKNLTSLYLKNNQITSLRPLADWLTREPDIYFEENYKDGLYLENVPLQDPPESVARQGARAILDYWKEIDARATEKNNEGRVLIVGRGGVGKTTLLEKLRKEAFVLDPDQKQTHGINIWSDWNFPVPEQEKENFRASVWDFGGQDIQHLTHQYFFSPRTVFVLVVNKRGMNAAGEATELHYWCRIIDLLGRQSGEKARVLVVQNVFTNEKTNAGVDLAPYQQTYGDCLELSFHRVNLGSQEASFTDLRKAIQTALLNVPGVGDARPGGWAAVRAALGEVRNKRRISWDSFADICTKHEITTEAGQLLLSRYLMQLGELLYYEKGSGALSESLLLDLDWVTKSVYSITGDQDIIDEHGRFREEQIVSYWESIGIASKRDRKLMLSLLQTDAFELCWCTPDGTYLTPTLFHVDEPDCLPVRTDLGLRLNYHYLPKGLLGQVIVRLHEYLEAQESFWRYGAYLAHDGCRARIARPDPSASDRSFITVDVAGESPQNYALLSLISTAFDAVHRQSFPRIRVSKEVPCPCERCNNPNGERHYFSYERLERDLANGDPEVYCSNNLPTSPDLLLRGLAQVSNPREMSFISQARDLIEEGDLTAVFELILSQHPNDDLRVISSNWKRLKKEQMLGTIRQEELPVQSAKITQSLLAYLTLLEDQFSGLTNHFNPKNEFQQLREDILAVKSIVTDTNQRVRSLQDSLNEVQHDLAQQGEQLFGDNKEQRVFFRKFEAYLETLPDEVPQPLDDPGYVEGSTKDKIKIGIDAMKLLSRATGIEVDGFSLKWEREFEKGTFRFPTTWRELKTVFVQ